MPIRILFAVWALALLLAGQAQGATPQVLAVVETVEPLRVTCAGETCWTELSTFCLQHESPAPLHGTPYRVASGGGLDLLVTTRDGAVRRLPAGAHLRFESVRGFTAVTATISRGALDALDAVSAALAVGANVSLLPNGPTVDADFEDEANTRRATGPLRTAGQRVVEGSGARIHSVRAINALLNHLPTIDDHAPPASREALWRAALTGRLGTLPPASLVPARGVLDICADRYRSLAGQSLSRCLSNHHDAMLEKLTHEYWQVAGAGS